MGRVDLFAEYPTGRDNLPALEVCIDSPEGLKRAHAGGADRVELCAALALGGLTPGPGLIELAADMALPAHMMIRPRDGSFVAAESEREAMRADIRAARGAGLEGVVLGAAHPSGELDRETLAELREEAGPMTATLHRVFDLTPDPIAAMEVAVHLGFDRILTSGGAPSAAEGIATIKRIVKAAGGRIEIMAGGGVTPMSCALLLSAGVDALHASCSRAADAGDRAAALGLGASRRTSASRVRALREAMTRASVTLEAVM